jgi:hypothetical protein
LISLHFSPSFPSASLCRKDSWKSMRTVSLTVSWPGYEPYLPLMRLPSSSSMTSSSDAPRRNLCRLMCLSSYVTGGQRPYVSQCEVRSGGKGSGEGKERAVIMGKAEARLKTFRCQNTVACVGYCEPETGRWVHVTKNITIWGGHTTGRWGSESAQRLHVPKPFVISCGHLIISTRTRIADCCVQRARNEEIKILTPIY